MYNSTLKILSVLLLTILISGCYHAKITTGERPSTQVVENKWATSFIGGLIPPPVVNVERECPNGVAMVETKHSFLNMIVGGLTFGIFTPMHITVTCAAGSTAYAPDVDQDAISIPKNSTGPEFVQAFQQAADQSAETGQPVYVYF